MLTPTVVNKLLQFYAIGNTPPASLVRTHPQGVDAAVLCLGSGDARHILFTAYTEQGFPARKIDVTCSDYMEEIIVRNVLLLSFLIDGLEADPDFDKLWNVYYHLYLDEYTFEFLAAQIQKLGDAAVSLDTWRDSKYGKVLRFADAATFNDVQAGLAKYAKAVKDKDKPAYSASFRTYIDKIKYLRKSIFNDEVPMATGYRSVAPAAEALDDIPDQFNSYWKTGTSNAPTTASLLPHNIPNPAFATSVSDSVLLHHAVNPTLGFHLGPAYIGLADGSPLKIRDQDQDKLPGRDKLAKAAQIEFRAMAKAFQALHGSFTIRFTSAEALAFSYTLQNCSSSHRSELTANWYRRQQDTRALELDAFEYGAEAVVKAPVAFDVVETSTMSDHLGVLNILVAAVPVLVNAASSTIHMETLIRNDVDQDETFATLLCGDTCTMSLLLGITPAEYYTNTRTTSSFDEALSETAATDGGQPESINQQLRTHMSWKLAHHFSSYRGNTSRNKVAANELSALLLSVYKDMFFYEDMERLRRYMAGGPAKRLGGRQLKLRYPLYHRGSLAALMRIIMDRVDTDWTSVCETIRHAMSAVPETQISLGPMHLAEFDTHMQMFDALPSAQHHRIMTVTLVVPRDDLKELFKDRVTQQAISPIFSVELFPGGDQQQQQLPFSHHFDDLQTMFGTITTTGTRGSPDYRVTVHEDSKGWHGKSQLIVSFNVSEQALKDARDADMVALKMHSNMRCLELCQGPCSPAPADSSRLIISAAQFGDAARVFTTQHMPGMAGLTKIVPPVFAPLAAQESESESERKSEVLTDLAVNLDARSGKVTTVTGHISIDSPEGKQLLQDPHVSIKLVAAPSPFVVHVVFGSNAALVLPVHFTVPVAADKAKTRIARKSSWIEVIAPLALPAQSRCLEGLVYPTVLDAGGLPVTLTCPHINLDVQPVVDLAVRDRRELMWLMMSTSLTFSRRETKMRELVMSSVNNTLGVSADLRLNIKESIFSVIQIASGLQGASTGLIAVMHPRRGGIHMLLLVSALRLDLHSGSVAVDAAVLPFTKDILAKQGVQAFLALTQRMQVCTINVDDAELVAWKTLLPAFAERCRTWQHTPGCEYAAARRVPVSLEDGGPVLCSCGAGKLPEYFIGIPMWDEAQVYATRVAITPLFCANAAEDPMDPAQLTREEEEQQQQQQQQQQQAPKDRCGVCRKGGPDVKLKACSRCRKAFYCSAECQKADWKRHKPSCRA